MQINKVALGKGVAAFVAGVAATLGAGTFVYNPGNLTSDEADILIESNQIMHSEVLELQQLSSSVRSLVETVAPSVSGQLDQAVSDLQYIESLSDQHSQSLDIFSNLVEQALLYDFVPTPQLPPPSPPPTPTIPPNTGALLQYNEHPVFQNGGAFGWLPDLTPQELFRGELWDHKQVWNAGWNSNSIQSIPSSLSNRTIVYNNYFSPVDGVGPHWVQRSYNVQGTLLGFTASRCGNFTSGKEGHGLYHNVFGPVRYERVRMYEMGAQFAQEVWRPRETRINPALWKGPQYWVEFIDCQAIYCGSINFGDSRASWPLAFYAPGQSLRVKNFVVRTQFPPVAISGKPGRQSHGAIYVGPASTFAYREKTVPNSPNSYFYAGDWITWTGNNSDPKASRAGDTFNGYFRTPNVEIIDLDCEIWNSSREEIHLRNVEKTIITRPKIIDHGGLADIVVVEDCGSVEIIDAQTQLNVWITALNEPFKTSGRPHFVVKPGTSFKWPLN